MKLKDVLVNDPKRWQYYLSNPCILKCVHCEMTFVAKPDTTVDEDEFVYCQDCEYMVEE